MRAGIRLLFCVALLSASTAGTSSATTINFESLPSLPTIASVDSLSEPTGGRPGGIPRIQRAASTRSRPACLAW